MVHIQGGELTSSVDEKVRHAITKLSNLHGCQTTKKIVIQMEQNKVFNVDALLSTLLKKLILKKSRSGKIQWVGYKVDLNKKYY